MMYPTLTKIAAALCLIASAGLAQAEEASPRPADRTLHYVIALQGDQALLDIQSAAAAAIPESVNASMEAALPAMPYRLTGGPSSLNRAFSADLSVVTAD